MHASDRLPTFSFPIGRLLGVRIRLSFLMPFVVAALMWRLGDLIFGLIAGLILVFSLLIHEFAHLLVGRKLDHSPGTMVLWPLGGMNTAASPKEFSASLLLSGSGPVVSLAVAAASGWELYRTGQLGGLINPFGTLDIMGAADFRGDCLRTVFVVNWCLTLFNLIPVRPLDAGQVLTSFLNLRFVELETRDLMLRIGLVVTLFGILAGFIFDISSLVALSAFLLVLHLQEATRWFQPPEPDESFLGYDFSEGYTSLHRDEKDTDYDAEEDAVAGTGMLDRWRARREEEKVRRDADERQAEEAQLDAILEKLHTQGRNSLTAREVSVLNRVSARLRHRNIEE